MGRFIVVHIPHIIPVIVAFAFLGRLALVVADQPPLTLDEAGIDAWRVQRTERARARRVRRSAARIGLIALVPLLGAAATGLVLYTFALDGHDPSSALSITHAVISGIALALVGWKMADAGFARLRRGLELHRLLTEGASLLLAALGLPLLASGAWLLAEPSEGSFASNAHLVASVGGSRSSACTCSATSAGRSTRRYASAPATRASSPISSRGSAQRTRPSSVAMQTAWAMLRAPSFARICRRCVFTVASPFIRLCAVSPKVRPLAAAQSTSSSLGVSTVGASSTILTWPRSDVSARWKRETRGSWTSSRCGAEPSVGTHWE